VISEASRAEQIRVEVLHTEVPVGRAKERHPRTAYPVPRVGPARAAPGGTTRCRRPSPSFDCAPGRTPHSSFSGLRFGGGPFAHNMISRLVQDSASNIISRTSCAHRHAWAIRAAQTRASFSEDTSIIENPPTQSNLFNKFQSRSLRWTIGVLRDPVIDVVRHCRIMTG
jgi:hypothetical protein